MKQIAACILLAVFLTLSASAGPIASTATPGETIPIEGPDEVLSAVRAELDTWATSPLAPTGCNGGDCCDTTLGETDADATNAKCVAFAKNYVASKNRWARETFSCLAADGDWACNTYVVQGTDQMVCQTMPPAGLLRLKDVADCATKVAAVQN